jgi:RimJ/RimL family protein N-acetyltransferase
VTEPVILRTDRLLLRPFSEGDLAPFAALNRHPLVVESLGSSPTRAESDAMVTRFTEEMDREGWGLWAAEITGGAEGGAAEGSGTFVGMIGLHRVNPAVPCAPAVEIAWRLSPEHWGQGYATEGAAAALDYGLTGAALPEIVAFTTTLNVRSQAVMTRLGMRRDLEGDFDHPSVPEGSPLRRHVLFRMVAS